MNKIIYDRNTVLSELRENVMEISFDKVNGQPRILRCTLMRYFLPENYKEQADVNFHTKNADILAVWDIDNKGWRAFRVNSVKMVQALDPLMFK
jgi:hypothetical protein